MMKHAFEMTWTLRGSSFVILRRCQVDWRGVSLSYPLWLPTARSQTTSPCRLNNPHHSLPLLHSTRPNPFHSLLHRILQRTRTFFILHFFFRERFKNLPFIVACAIGFVFSCSEGIFSILNKKNRKIQSFARFSHDFSLRLCIFFLFFRLFAFFFS